MSYGVASALQSAIYQRLLADDALAGVVGAHVYDALPAGTVPEIYVSLGAEVVKDASSKDGGMAIHDFSVTVTTQLSGFQLAKDAGTAVSDALIDAPLILARGKLIGLRFLKATAKRTGTGEERQIDMRFQAHVEDS